MLMADQSDQSNKSSGPQQINEDKAKVRGATRLILWLFAIFAGATVLSVLVGSGDGNEKWTTVAQISCTPDEKVWDRSEGFCYTGRLSPGLYRVRIQSAGLKLGTGGFDKNGHPQAHLAIPYRGLSLASWADHPEYVERFQEAAFYPELRMVGAPLARVSQGPVFDPLESGQIQIQPGEQIGVGMNVTANRGAFVGTEGALRVRIERREETSS
jgi:hypothetical protein